jgi:hypothetical protein
MKASDIAIGTRVRSKSSCSGGRGTVVGNKLRADTNDSVAVEWDNGTVHRMQILDLELLDDDLEAAYEAISLRVAEASAALARANKIAREHNTSLSELRLQLGMHSLLEELDNAGWSSSSMRC